MKLLIERVSSWMKNNLDLVTIVLVTSLTWLSRLDQSRSIILKEASLPQPLFLSEFVNDFPNGNLSGALNKFAKNEIILIYIYSHWDEESVAHKATIEQLAEYVHYKIPVIAVNCWKNTTDCFDIIKPNRFPQLYGYVSNYLLIEYKRSIELIEVFNFINSLFYPFHFPKTNIELENLIKLYDVSFITCFHSQSSSFTRNVKILHQISSLYKGKDSNDLNIAFILLSETDETFMDFRNVINLNENEMVLYTSSGVAAKYSGKLVSSDIILFLNKNVLSPIISKYSPSGVKSLKSQDLLMRGALVLYIHNEKNQFLWNNIKMKYYFYTMALRTKKCASIKDMNVSISNLLQLKKEILIRDYVQNHKENIACQHYLEKRISSNFTFDIFNIISTLKSNQSNYFSDYNVDPFVTTSHLMNMEWICRKHLILSDYLWDQDSCINEEFLKFDDISMGSCQDHYNRSIQFAEVYGNKYPKLLENLGISLDSDSLPRVIVVDWKNEIIHHMNSEVNFLTLNHLIAQLSINNLTMHMNSDDIFNEQFQIPFHPIDVMTLEKELRCTQSDTVVYYYTPWCSYCSSLSNIFIMLSRYFASYPTIHFTSVNTFTNDLPYKFQSERVPSLIMYPRGRKSESIVFHITAESLSLSSLIKFVLENSGDANLNLNAPNFTNEHNVTCDRKCLESAQEVVAGLLRKFSVALRCLTFKVKDIYSKLRELCSLFEFDMFDLRLSSARDWEDYHARHFKLNYQSQLVSVFNNLWRKKKLLRKKLKKLSSIHGGIDVVLAKGSLQRSMISLVSDILVQGV